MPSFSASAPGKVILFGEHAVVYGEPAIAVPVTTTQATAIVSARVQSKPGEIWIEAPDISLSAPLDQLDVDHPLRTAIQIVIGDRDLNQVPSCKIQITSEIPPSSGMGSSAAISTAIIRAFSAFLGKRLSNEQVSDLTFEVEKIHHGNPSGIDNTVISYQKPIYYRKGDPFEFLTVGQAFTILIIYCGKPGNTRKAVSEVRERWQEEPEQYNQIFTRIGKITQSAKRIMEEENPDQLGPLMDENHELLCKIGVSSPELNQLVLAAKKGGALGAKLSGGGLGGHIIALVGENVDPIQRELEKAGAFSILINPIQNQDFRK